MTRHKRLAASIAAIALLAAACAGEADSDETGTPAASEADDTSQDTETEDDAEADDGNEALAGSRVGYSIPVSGLDVIDTFADNLAGQAARSGIDEDLTVVSAEGDPLQQVTDVEGLVAQAFDAVIITAGSDAGWEVAIDEAINRGVPVVNHSGFAITGANQNVMLGFYESGYEVGRQAAEWLNENHGGTGEVGVLGQSGDSGLSDRSQGMVDGIEENSDAVIVGQSDAYDRDEGASGAANLIAANPDLRVLLAFNDDVGLGALRAATEAGIDDPSQFLIAGTDGLPDALDAIEAGSPYQITWGYMFEFSAVLTMRDTVRILQGEEVPPTRVQEGRIVTADNVGEYRELIADPFSEQAQPIYDEVSYYIDEPLETGEGI